MTTMAPIGPYGNFNFIVEIAGVTVAGFAECTGLGSEVEVIEYREGGDQAVRKLAGLRKFSNITLKRGVTASRELYDWHTNILNGTADRRNGSIILLDNAKNEVARWNFYNAFPFKWSGPCFDANGNDVAIEALILCCEGIDRSL